MLYTPCPWITSDEKHIFQNECLRLALTYYDRARSIDLHDFTNVLMIKTRMTALAVKTFRLLENTSVLRIWCWILRSLKNDRGQKHNSGPIAGLQSRLTHKHGWRITVEVMFPQRTRAPREPFWVIYQKQWALSDDISISIIPIMGQKTWLTDIGWTLFPQRTGDLKGAVMCDISKQWALYHSTAGGRVWS